MHQAQITNTKKPCITPTSKFKHKKEKNIINKTTQIPKIPNNSHPNSRNRHQASHNYKTKLTKQQWSFRSDTCSKNPTLSHEHCSRPLGRVELETNWAVVGEWIRVEGGRKARAFFLCREKVMGGRWTGDGQWKKSQGRKSPTKTRGVGLRALTMVRLFCLLVSWNEIWIK